MGHLKEKIKDSHVLIYGTLAEAQQIADKYLANYTEVLTSTDGTQFAVYIRPIDRHILTQTEHDLLVEFPNDFYTFEI